jgi:hypothetical protein
VWHRGDRLWPTERDLTALADGSLEAGRRELVERLVAASAELQLRLGEQRRAVLAARSIATDRAPFTLRTSSRTLTARRPSRLRTKFLGVAAAGMLAALGCTLTIVGAGVAGPTVVEAAAVAVRPPTAPVGEPRDDAYTLPQVRAAGLPFPYWEDRFGWVATGVRTDTVDGRRLTTVLYRHAGRAIAYTIVSGAPLDAGAQAVASSTHDHTVLRSLDAGGRRIVTWLRRGHTCVLSGIGVPVDALLKLAAWRGHGEIPY